MKRLLVVAAVASIMVGGLVAGVHYTLTTDAIRSPKLSEVYVAITGDETGKLRWKYYAWRVRRVCTPYDVRTEETGHGTVVRSVAFQNAPICRELLTAPEHTLRWSALRPVVESDEHGHWPITGASRAIRLMEFTRWGVPQELI